MSKFRDPAFDSRAGLLIPPAQYSPSSITGDVIDARGFDYAIVTVSIGAMITPSTLDLKMQGSDSLTTGFTDIDGAAFPQLGMGHAHDTWVGVVTVGGANGVFLRPIATVSWEKMHFDVSVLLVGAGDNTSATSSTYARDLIPSSTVLFGPHGNAPIVAKTGSSSFTVDDTPAPGRTSGWTDFELRSGAREVYVDATGGDDGDDGTAESPVQTIQAGVDLLTAGQGDHLLFKRGETWNAGGDSYSIPSGFSDEYPTLVSAYGDEGTAMPHIDATGSNGLFDAQLENYTAFAHLDLEGEGWVSGSDGRWAIVFRGGTSHRVEGCWINGFGHGLYCLVDDSTELGPTALVVRRNVIHSCWTQGIYCAASQSSTFEENVVYACGHSGGTHNAYLTDNVGLLWRRNYSLGSMVGMGLKHKQNYNMTVEQSVFALNANGLSVHVQETQPNDPNTAITPPLHGEGNVVEDVLIASEGNSVSDEGPTCFNITAQRDLTVNNLIILDADHHAEDKPAFRWTEEFHHFDYKNIDINGLIIANYGNSGMLFQINPTDVSTQVSNVRIRNSSIINLKKQASASTNAHKIISDTIGDPARVIYSNNRYHRDTVETAFPTNRLFGRPGDQTMSFDDWKTWTGDTLAEEATATGETATKAAFTDPTRTLETWTVSVLGGGNAFRDDMVPALLARRKGAWSDSYNVEAALNYVRAGFDLAAVS